MKSDLHSLNHKATLASLGEGGRCEWGRDQHVQRLRQERTVGLGLGRLEYRDETGAAGQA